MPTVVTWFPLDQIPDLSFIVFWLNFIEWHTNS